MGLALYVVFGGTLRLGLVIDQLVTHFKEKTQ